VTQVPWLPPHVRNGDDTNRVGVDSVEQAVREASDEYPTKAPREPMPDLRVHDQGARRPLDLGDELQSKTGPVRLVARSGRNELCLRLDVKGDTCVTEGLHALFETRRPRPDP